MAYRKRRVRVVRRRARKGIRTTTPFRKLLRNQITRVVHTVRSFDYNHANFAVVMSGNGSSSSNSADGIVLATGTANSGNWVYASFSVVLTMSILPDFGEYTSLFEKYKFTKCTFSLRCFQTQSFQPTITAQPPLSGFIWMVTDDDDNVTYTPSNGGLQIMRQRTNIQSSPLFRLKAHKRSFTPFTLDGNMSKRSPWIDTLDNTKLHYGVKGLIQIWVPTPSLQNYVWVRIEGKANVSLKGFH